MSQEGPRRNMSPSDLTDAQWKILAPMIPPPRTQHGGRPREVDMREVITTIWYQHRSGCQWAMLPHDLLPKSTVYDYLVQWRDDGTWAQRVDALRTQSRVQAGRAPTPSAVCSDSQAVKTTAMGGTERGYDGGKNVKGRQRHGLVDTRGRLVALLITGAGLDDGVAAPKGLAKLSPIAFPRLVIICGDSQYHHHHLHAWMAAHRPGWRLEVKTRPEGTTGFTPWKKRWVVERTHAWNGRYRRTSTDDERQPESSAAMIHISHMPLMFNRRAPRPGPAFHDRGAAAGELGRDAKKFPDSLGERHGVTPFLIAVGRCP